MPQRKNRVTGSVSSTSSKQPELKDPGGLRGNGGRQGNGAGMEKHSQESNQQSKLESATGPFSNINTQLMPPPKKSESMIQKYSCKNSSSGGYLLLSPVPASTRYFNKSLFNKRNES